MALILEIRDRRGLTTFHPLNAFPVRIGRGMMNDIILDDPFLDAQHLAVECDETGAVTMRDLGSVNGIIDNGSRIAGSLGVLAGTEVRAGRTTFRFHDRDVPVAPALVDAMPGSTVDRRWAVSTLAKLGVVVATLGVFGFISWLGTTERSSASSVLGSVFAAAALLLVWAGIWGLSLRGAERRVQLGAHIAVASLAVLALVVYGTVNEWFVFLFPDVAMFSLLFDFAVLCVIAAVVAGHLSIGTSLSRRQRWRAGLIASATTFALVLLIGWSQMDKFSDTPRFPRQLKPMSASLVPTHSVDEFVKAMSEARDEADKAIAKGTKAP
jgi:Inner membrane component of T3SS, cytoplasmic domain